MAGETCIDYTGLVASLTEQLDLAQTYDERASIRAKIREIKRNQPEENSGPIKNAANDKKKFTPRNIAQVNINSSLSFATAQKGNGAKLPFQSLPLKKSAEPIKDTRSDVIVPVGRGVLSASKRAPSSVVAKIIVTEKVTRPVSGQLPIQWESVKEYESQNLTLEQMCAGWINKELDQHIEGTKEALCDALRDIPLLCSLVNQVVPDTIDLRAVNQSDVSQSTKMRENATLLLRSASAIGCDTGEVCEDDVVAGDWTAVSHICCQLAKVMASNRLPINHVQKSAVRKKCVQCSVSPTAHYLELANKEVLCRECLFEPNLLFAVLAQTSSVNQMEGIKSPSKRGNGKQRPSSVQAARTLFNQTNELSEATRPVSLGGGKSNTAKLLKWAQCKTFGYDNVDVCDFSASWNDGLAFCALLSTLVGDNEINFESLSPNHKKENFELAFSVCERHGVARYLDVDDMVTMTRPDPLSIATYVSAIHHAFAK